MRRQKKFESEGVVGQRGKVERSKRERVLKVETWKLESQQLKTVQEEPLVCFLRFKLLKLIK